MGNKPLHELRVLAGPQEGASLSLKSGSSVDVGSLTAGGCQVVLRDPRVSEQRVRLHVRPNDIRLEVLAGAVELSGRRFIAPCSFDWPCFLPVRIGDTLLAVGQPGDDAGWAQALNLALAPAADLPDTAAHDAQAAFPATSADASPEASGQTEPRPGARRRAETWLAIGGGVIAVAAFGLLAFVAVATPAKVGVEPLPQKAARVLKAVPEFGKLRVEADPDQQHLLFIRGDLLTLADRARLDRSLADASIDASVEVRVGEQVAAAVRDVYRMNGIVAETAGPTNLAGVGLVKVSTRELDLARLQSIEATARRDVPGLMLLESENTPPVVPPPPTPVVDDPGKRVASIVPGATPYVVTADGTRYFIGALLPSGHRLASIEDQQVMLDKDGVLSALKF
jgi:type III secretion protein D